MASVNKVILIGNCGRDPEIRYMPDGNAICNVSIATTMKWKDKASGDLKEETEWSRVVFRGRLAEIAGEYLKKGSPVYVEGRLRTRKWTDKDGIEKFTTEVVANEMQLLGGRDRDNSEPRERAQKPMPKSGSANGAAPPSDYDDEIPFAPIGRGLIGHAI